MIGRRSLLLAAASLAGCSAAGAQDIASGDLGQGGGDGNAPRGPIPGNAIAVRGGLLGGGPAPVRIGRAFVQGEIKGAPQAVLEGARLPTQADVKTRWPDGSVQHAVLSFLVPHVPATVAFADAPAAPAQPLPAAEMLAADYDFDAVIAITFAGQTQRASARAMLQKGDYTVWAAGRVATTIVLADHSAQRRWDMGPDGLRPMRPIFHATFWPALRRVEVRAIGEIANTEALADLQYDLAITAGAAAPKQVYAQAAVPHYAATRWTRRFWIGAAPSVPSIDHNLPHQIAAYAFPRFDTSLRASAKGLAADQSHWADADKALFQPGLWQPRMPNTGGRGDIGPYTAWVARWLLGFDAGQFALISAMADLAGAWPLHVREGNPAKRFDAAGQVPAIGHVASVYARPTAWLLDPRDPATSADKVTIHGARLAETLHEKPSGGWIPDGDHTPDPYSALYTLTGDPFYLEQLQFWAGVEAMKYDPAYKGPGPSGGIHDQTRGCAWALRTRVHAAWLSPDAAPEKAYFTRLIDDAVALWEGSHGIHGTRFEGTPLWRFGQQKPFEPPLHVFEENPLHAYDGLKQELVSKETAPWQDYMLIFEFGRAREKGFPTAPLLSWLGVSLTGQFQDPNYDPINLVRYYHPVRDAQGRLYERFSELLPVFKAAAPPIHSLRNVGDGYATYAYGASTMLLHEPGGAKAYAWLRDRIWLPNRNRFADDPKWAYLPRA